MFNIRSDKELDGVIVESEREQLGAEDFCVIREKVVSIQRILQIK